MYISEFLTSLPARVIMEQYAALSNEDILSLPKETPGVGSFILSLRDETEFFDIHPTGYHCIPHIGTFIYSRGTCMCTLCSIVYMCVTLLVVCAGTYGQEYRLTSPILLVSLPTTPRYVCTKV